MVILIALLVAGCHAIDRPPTGSDVVGTIDQGRLSASQAYAGEILGHMMAVVTGTTGKAANRFKWRTRGLDIPLKFALIQKWMADPEFDKSKVLVYDAEIIGLSRALYHFDSRLNQFKGALPFSSPFPSDELIALRMLLIRKIARGEKIRLDAVVSRLPLIIAAGDRLSPSDSQAMGLSAAEAALLADACRSEPVLAEYIRHSAVVSALNRMGILEAPPRLPPVFNGPALTARAPSTLVIISVLPSFQTTFTPATVDGREILVATDAYHHLTTVLKQKILSSSADMIIAAARQHPRDLPALPGSDWSARWHAFTGSRVVFFMPETHPLAITPYTADAVVGSVCPVADLNIFLVGTDVIRSMEITPERDVFPHTNRLYVDESDVKYGVIEETVVQISRWLVEKTGPAFFEEVRRKGLS